MKKALILGITGQVGSYLAELLLSKGYEVFGLIRRSSSFNTQRIDPFFDKLSLFYGDLLDPFSIQNVLVQSKPDEVYILAAQSHVKVSFETPQYTCQVDGVGVLNVLESVRNLGLKCRIYNASTSEMFGSSPPPQNESTVFMPQSPYACAKLFAYHLCCNYREAYNMHITNGILFNNESERRLETFVTRKITKGVAKIIKGEHDKIYLGNLDSERDWGYSKEYAEAIWLMMQHNQPDNFVIATGEKHSVREFVEEVFSLVGLDWKKHIVIDPRYFRPLEVNSLCGDASKAKLVLGWEPKTKFKELAKIMLESDLKSEGLSL